MGGRRSEREVRGMMLEGEVEKCGTERVNGSGGRTHDRDMCPDCCTASTSTSFPHRLGQNSDKATQNKSIVARHAADSTGSERTPGRQSEPSESLTARLWRVCDVTTSPVITFTRTHPVINIPIPSKDIYHIPHHHPMSPKPQWKRLPVLIGGCSTQVKLDTPATRN